MGVINELFLSTTSGNQVRMFLALFCITFAVQLIKNFADQLSYLKTSPLRIYGNAPLVLGTIRMRSVNATLFVLFGILLILSLASAASGLFVRMSIGVALVSYFFYFGQITSLAYVQRKTNLIPLVLLILLVSPSIGQPFGVSTPQWPLILVKIAIVQMYLSAGTQKLRNVGLHWISGDSLRAYLTQHYLWGDMKGAIALANHPRICAVLSTLVLTFEMTVWIILFVPGATYLYVVAGILFHAATYFTMRINYLKYLCPVYTVFIADAACRWLGYATR